MVPSAAGTQMMMTSAYDYYNVRSKIVTKFDRSDVTLCG